MLSIHLSPPPSYLPHLLCVALMPGVPIAADAQEDARTRLLQATSIRCQLNIGSTATWKAGSPSIERSESGEGEVTFDAIEPEESTARAIGNVGAEDVLVLSTQIGFTFVEVTDAGNLVVTTVFASTAPERPNHFIAVESRHVGWPASWPEGPKTESAPGPFPAQYHGTCTILK